MPSVRYGDLILDEACLFAVRRDGKVAFTRNERAVLLVLSRNPQRLMTRSRLLDRIEPDDGERSDRYIDFLVNRLRAKLGDNPKAPAFISTQYGEGYIWIATPSPAAPAELPAVDAAIMIVPSTDGSGAASPIVAAFAAQVRDAIAARVAGTTPAIAWHWQPGAGDRSRYMLQLNLAGGAPGIAGSAVVSELPSRRIIRTLRLAADAHDRRAAARLAERIADTIDGALRQAASDAANGLGIARDDPLELRIRAASTILVPGSPRWSGGAGAAHGADDPDAALQRCLTLLAQLTDIRPFEILARAERDRIEDEIEETALARLPATEANPLRMFAAAKLLYFVDRGHLALVEDVAARAQARAGDSPAAYALIGQLAYARGAFDAAVATFDRGLRRTGLEPLFRLHLQVLKCLALLAADEPAPLASAIADIGPAPASPPQLRLMMDLTFTPPERPLPAPTADALAARSANEATSAIDYLYFTSARHLIAPAARANVMRGLVGRIRMAHGDTAVPGFVAGATGLSDAPNRRALRRANT